MDFGRYKRTEINFSERSVYCEPNDTVFEIVAAGKKEADTDNTRHPGGHSCWHARHVRVSN